MKKALLSLAVVGLVSFGLTSFAQDQDKDKKKDGQRMEQPSDMNKDQQKKEEDQQLSNEQAPSGNDQDKQFDPNQPKSDQTADSARPATAPVQEPVK